MENCQKWARLKGGGKSKKLWADRKISMRCMNSIIMCVCCVDHLFWSPNSMDHTVEISGIHLKEGRSLKMVSVK